MDSEENLGFFTEEPLPFIEADLDFNVESEIVESDSYKVRLDEFVSLTGKAIFEYSTRFDAILAEQGPTAFYSEYIHWRRIAAALQSAYKAKYELKLAETDLADLNDEIDRMRREAEDLFGTAFVKEMEEFGGNHGDTT